MGTDRPQTLAFTVRQIAAQQRTPRQLVERYLAEIERRESQLHAWTLIDAVGALHDADRRTEAARSGERLGPLHGIPLGIKDIIDVRGLPTRAGSQVTNSAPATADAPVVARLRGAGAIVLGKTVTTEFACFDPPPTRNPRHPDRTPGGSSSGSAAAVAARLCAAAVGSQTGGSILRPASFCGVAGFKPSHGAVPTEQVVPLSPRLDHVGPIAACVDDLAVLFAVMADDGTWAESGLPNEYVAAQSRQPNLRTLEDYFLTTADPAVQSVTRQALARLGAPPATRPLPASFGDVHAHHRVLMAHDAARAHGSAYSARPLAFGPHVARLLEDGLTTSAASYEAAIQHQQAFREELAEWLEAGTILLTPTTVTPAPDRSSTGDPRFNSPWSYLGWPTVTIPCGVAEDGLPCGLQVIGPFGADWEVLAAAAWCERTLESASG